MSTARNLGILGGFMTHAIWLSIAKLRLDEPFGMIHRWCMREATDPRDKIYGLLGMCEAGRLPLTEKCDYSLSPARVFQTLTLELILDENSLRPLTICPRLEASHATPGIPSWALDLGGSGPNRAPDQYYQMHGYWEYKAGEGLGQLDLGAIKSQVTQGTLSLTGIYIDTVVRVVEGYTPVRFKEWNPSASEPLLQRWYDTAVRNECDTNHGTTQHSTKMPYPGKTYDRDEAFARLVLGEFVRTAELKPQRRANAQDLQDVWKLMNLQGSSVHQDKRRTVYGMMTNQTLLLTKSGLMGCGHVEAQVGDEVWIFRGGNVPFLVRSRSSNGQSGYTFVGHCYVQGIMQGEVIANDRKHTEKVITLH
jgi:hypothetical protein